MPTCRRRFRPRSIVRRAGGRCLALLAALLIGLAACTDEAVEPPPTPAATPVPGMQTTATPTPTPTAVPTPTPTPTPVVGLPEQPRVGIELITPGLTAPLDMAMPEDGTGRWFIVEQSGLVRVVTADGELREEPLLDLRDRIVHPNPQFNFDERGVLGIALHPEFASNGRLFVYYSAPLRVGAPGGWNHTSHLSEFTISPDDSDRADPGSERIILQVDQPGISHNAGHIRFGPDGYLYVPLGDGAATGGVGEGHTPGVGNAQDPSNLLGTVLRIDVDADGDGAYGIPPDNPFVDDEDVRSEIWVYGLRNPFDISFDPLDEHGLLIADAGESRFEWVNIARGGENFGWPIREGSHCFDPRAPVAPPSTEYCPEVGPRGAPLVDPVAEYARVDFGAVVVGAQIYRGDALPDLRGRMVIADWSLNWGLGANGGLLVAAPKNEREGRWSLGQVEIVSDIEGAVPGSIGRYIMALGRDADGELYLLANEVMGAESGRGALYRVTPAAQ